MKKVFQAITTAGLLFPTLALLLGCASEATPEPQKNAASPPKSKARPPILEGQKRMSAESTSRDLQIKWARASNALAFDLYQSASRQKKTNFALCPLGVSSLLALLNNGASGETKTQIEATLHLSASPLEQINEGANALLQALQNPKSAAQFQFASSLWVAPSAPILPNFLQRSQAYFGAQIAPLPPSPDPINQWTSQKTSGKIPTILDAIPAGTQMIALNAAYFKASWLKPFDPRLTASRPFHLENGKTKSTPLMTRQDRFLYVEADGWQGVCLPFADSRFRLLLALPKSGQPFSAAEASLNAERWQEWLSSLGAKQGTVRLPRFSFEFEIDLKPLLQTLGMAQAFDPRQANFNALSAQPTYLSAFKQKAFFEVNEEGAEAAAVTQATVSPTAVRPVEKPFEFTANRPFFYALYDSETECLLFMGAYRQ